MLSGKHRPHDLPIIIPVSFSICQVYARPASSHHHIHSLQTDAEHMSVCTLQWNISQYQEEKQCAFSFGFKNEHMFKKQNFFDCFSVILSECIHFKNTTVVLCNMSVVSFEPYGLGRNRFLLKSSSVFINHMYHTNSSKKWWIIICKLDIQSDCCSDQKEVIKGFPSFWSFWHAVWVNPGKIRTNTLTVLLWKFCSELCSQEIKWT